MGWIWTYLRTTLASNFHEVVPGRIYRSATPSPENLEKYRRKFGIKIWLDLRMPKDHRDSSFLAAQCAIDGSGSASNESRCPSTISVSYPTSRFRVGLEILTDETAGNRYCSDVGNRHRAGLLCAVFRNADHRVDRRGRS